MTNSYYLTLVFSLEQLSEFHKISPERLWKHEEASWKSYKKQKKRGATPNRSVTNYTLRVRDTYHDHEQKALLITRIILWQEAWHFFTKRRALAFLRDLLTQRMSFKVNVISVVIDAYLFSHVYIYFVFLFWCTGYLVGNILCMKPN